MSTLHSKAEASVATQSKQPNILLIMCDQYRGDCLSYKGHPDVLTPNLDSLAAEGISFDNAYTPTPSCIPARATLFTGKNASHTGRVGYQDGIPWTYDNMLAELLGNNGYQTQCVGKMHVHPPRNTCGFDHVKLHDGYLGYYRNKTVPLYMHQEKHDDYLYFLKDKVGMDADVTTTGIDPNARISYPWPYKDEYHPTYWATTESIRFLETRDRDKPFFLMTSYVRPHQPFDAPEAFYNIYKDKELRPPFRGEWEDETNTLRQNYIKDSVFGTTHEESIDRAMKGYYASITHTDSQIGRLIGALQEDGSYEDTVIIFLSDHGELLFDHLTFRKSFPYQGSVQVPFIVRVGRNIAQTDNVDRETLVSLEDVLPTLVDFAGGDIPQDVDGLSLKQDILSQGEVHREYIHGEHAFGRSSNQFIVTQKDKYIWYSVSGKEEYFDLARDPNELVNLIHEADREERINTLRGYLIRELENRDEPYVRDGILHTVEEVPEVLAHLLD